MHQKQKRILVVDPIHIDAVNKLEESGFLVDINLFPKLESLPKLVSNYNALICRTNTKLSGDFFKNANHLDCVALASTGYDQIDIESAKKYKVPILGLPSTNKDIDVYRHGNFISTAEHTILLILAALGNFHSASVSMKAGKWDKPNFIGSEAYGKTLGFIGFGRIAKLVAVRARAFGMQTIAYDPHVFRDEMSEHNTEKMTLEDLCRQSDIITIHAPKTPETVSLLDKKCFDSMKKGVILINTARAEIINKEALIEALENEKVARVALDVFVNEPYDIEWDLVKDDRIIPTPHIGGSTTEAMRRISLSTAESIINFLQHGNDVNLINKF
ncbi:hydroxyacid dehydrogenase [Candidatus Nomurabacteria bacterium]|nr:hydroxyacid dehydrogenase [Candidatus Kaiserbacteria bacterium]MCB9815093.1 hydroxyacid dehydrogenase [Candidatus Nomurabacteria bacterium]